MKFSLHSDFSITPQRYWRVFFSEPYNQALYEKALGWKRKLLEQSEDGDLVRRSVHYLPQTPVPAPLRAVVPSFGYTETDLLDRHLGVMIVTISTDHLREQCHIHGTYVVRPGPKGCGVEFSGQVDIHVPVAGPAIEDYLVAQLRHSWDLSDTLVRSWKRG